MKYKMSNSLAPFAIIDTREPVTATHRTGAADAAPVRIRSSQGSQVLGALCRLAPTAYAPDPDDEAARRGFRRVERAIERVLIGTAQDPIRLISARPRGVSLERSPHESAVRPVDNGSA